MAFDVHERNSAGSESSVHLIDLTEDEQEAPFAVREAGRSADDVPGRIPDRAEIMAWLENHPVVVGIATGVLCFAIIAGAMSTVLGSDSANDSDDPVAGAALSDADGGQGSFSSSGAGGSNFTSDASKLSRTGAGKLADGAADGETAAGANTKSGSANGLSARNSGSADPTTAGTSNLDQSATIGGRAPGTGNAAGQAAGTGNAPGRAPGTASSTTRPAGTNANAGPAGGNSTTTLNPGPNVSGPISPPTTSRATTSTQGSSNQTTVTTARQTSSTSPSTVPTTAATTPTTVPTTAPTTPTTPVPVNLMIAAPGNGSSQSFETPTNFAANYVPGASQYCWAFIQGGSTVRTECSGSTTYQLPARPSGIAPGLVTVVATASGPFGSVSDTIQISLVRSRVMNNPTRDIQIGTGALRIGVINMEGADQYCFRLTQSSYDSGSLCYSSPGNTFNKHDPIWDSLSPGSLTVSAMVYGGGTLLASDSVTIQLLAAS